jgi:hypothetical protein
VPALPPPPSSCPAPPPLRPRLSPFELRLLLLQHASLFYPDT